MSNAPSRIRGRRAAFAPVRYRREGRRRVDARSRLPDRYGADLLSLARGAVVALAWNRGSRWVANSVMLVGGRPERGGATMPRFDRIAQSGAHRRTRGGLVALTVLLGIGTLGCSGDDGATPSTSTTEARRSSTTTETTGPASTIESTTTTSGSTPPGESTEEEIVARYIAFWDARFAANSGTPNPDDPALRDLATGAQLDAVIAETRANLENGLAFRPAANPSDIQRVDVIQLEGDHAVVQECVVTDGVIYRRD
ncbi:MAG TPA: hypothetical protein PKE56_18865, partial [Acidimicrobiales bacterium]|nr:hypothetical protein [Acidimicrobiales bacterium]